MSQHPFADKSFNQVVYVGGGDGSSIAGLMAQLNASRWLVIEGDEKTFNELQKTVASQELKKVSIKHSVVSTNGSVAQWHRYNSNEFNGLLKASGLFQLFPGLKLTTSEPVSTQTLSDLLDEKSLDGKSNLLIIDIPGFGSELLSAAAASGAIDWFDHLMVTDAKQGLFENQTSEAAAWVQESYFELVAQDKDDPDFPVLFGEVSMTSQKMADVIKERDELRQALDSLTKTFTESQAHLLKKIDELIAAQHQQTQKITDTVAQKTANTTKQIEAFLGVQQFFDAGEVGLNFHGWPISSDIAMYLLNKIKQENFDLIIEFGSGTSTIMFAKAIATLSSESFKQLPNHDGQQGIEHAGSEKQSRAVQLGEIEDAGEIPSRIVSFEHNKNFYDQTLAGLRDASVQQLVSLVHAPLVDWHYKDEDYLYYDCDKTLANIAEHFEGRTAKIMVFIDGPPASTGDQARYPAVPKILQHLSRHELHIIMDDYVREDEKKSAGRWSKMIEERGIPCEKGLIRLEKDGFSWTLNRGS